MNMRVWLIKNRGAVNRLLLIIGSFLLVHYIVIPRMIAWKYAGRIGRVRSPAQDALQTLVYYKPLDVISYNKQWQIVNDPTYEVYLFSAYFDDRQALPQYQVRIIAIAENSTKGLMCLLWYRNRKEPDKVPANMTFIGETVTQNFKSFSGVLISCKVPPNRWPPESVSIISLDSIVPSNLVTVHQPARPPMMKDFVLCVPPIYGGQKEGKFVEWLEVLKYLGVTKVFLYDNQMATQIERIVKLYVERGFISLTSAPWPMVKQNKNLRKVLTATVLNDCFYQNILEYNKVIVTDLDEIIVPRIHDNYLELVTYIDDTLPTHPGWSYKFKNVYFWLDFEPFTEDTPFMVMTRYLMRTPPTLTSTSDRSITDTKVCLAINMNQCEQLLPQYKNLSDWSVAVNMNISMKHHYKHCDLDVRFNRTGLCNDSYEIVDLDSTATKFIDKITTQVVEILWRFDLVDIFNLAENSLKEFMADEIAMNRTRIENGSIVTIHPMNGTDAEIDVPMDPSAILKNAHPRVMKEIETGEGETEANNSNSDDGHRDLQMTSSDNTKHDNSENSDDSRTAGKETTDTNKSLTPKQQRTMTHIQLDNHIKMTSSKRNMKSDDVTDDGAADLDDAGQGNHVTVTGSEDVPNGKKRKNKSSLKGEVHLKSVSLDSSAKTTGSKTVHADDIVQTAKEVDKVHEMLAKKAGHTLRPQTVKPASKLSEKMVENDNTASLQNENTDKTLSRNNN